MSIFVVQAKLIHELRALKRLFVLISWVFESVWGRCDSSWPVSVWTCVVVGTSRSIWALVCSFRRVTMIVILKKLTFDFSHIHLVLTYKYLGMDILCDKIHSVTPNLKLLKNIYRKLELCIKMDHGYYVDFTFLNYTN